MAEDEGETAAVALEKPVQEGKKDPTAAPKDQAATKSSKTVLLQSILKMAEAWEPEDEGETAAAALEKLVPERKKDPTAASKDQAATKSSKKSRKKKAKEDASGAGKAEGGGVKNLQQLLSKMSVEMVDDGGKKEHKFWDTQPVPKLDEKVSDMGPLEEEKAEVRTEPFSLPSNFIWDQISLEDEDQISELYQLLYENYVEDDDNMFRFDYSREFLRWALQPPGWKPSWYVGVRVCTSRKLVGFISAVPAVVKIKGHERRMVEINFLCVHKKLRSKRVAPVLIKEITRRVNLEGIFQAIYTAGVLLPKPISICRYWHRSLSPKKLVDVQFSSLHRHMTLQRMIRIYKLPEETKTVGLRPAERRDMAAILRLLNEHLGRFDLSPVFQSVEEVEYWLNPRNSIITCYVVENPASGEVTDMFSFYHLPSTIMNHPLHKTLNVTYLFYSFHTVTPLRDLLYDALILAKKLGADVFNALDIAENKTVFEELKFGVGDGNLHYYFFNWKCPELPSEKVALILQ